MSKILILNYGINNIFSIFNSISQFSNQIKIISEISELNNYKFNKLIIPGVGSFPRAMHEIKSRKLDKLLYETYENNISIISICLGFQILFEASYEIEKTSGLGILNGDLVPFDKKLACKINTGWRKVVTNKEMNNKVSQLIDGKYFYHTHSYYLSNYDEKIALSYSKNDNFLYCSSIMRNNIFGFQFHPEKSGQNGLELIRNLIQC